MKTASKVKTIKLNYEQDEEEVEEIPAKNEPVEMAKWLEKKGRLDEAAKIYERLLKAHPWREYNYSRLMMIYRKEKDYKNELRVINTGIKAFEEFYKPSVVGKNKNVIKLSKQLNVLVGLTDKKGNPLFDAGPIGKWKKRKQLVLKKMGKV